MKPRRFKPLLFPAILLAVGFVLGTAAETAVARWQDYGLYGLLRPAADLVLVIAVVWLVVAAIRVVLKPAAPRA